MPPDTPQPAAAPAPALDETMLAMDVVDTLRHAETLVERELSEGDRAAALTQRLREIYASQGIAVPERILAEGVARIAESRFTYQPTAPSFQRRLATLWATRARWGRATAVVAALLVLVAGGWWFGIERPAELARIAEQRELQEGLPRALTQEHERIGAATRNADALARAERLLQEGQAAARAGAAADARARLAEMQALRGDLAQDYQVRIVSRPGEQSGIWRVPNANTRARNYYLIVEAVDAQGRAVPVSITSEEDGRTARTAKWGLRVPEAEFERIRRDKQEDGVIDRPVIGRKPAGELATQWSVPTTGGAILQW